MLFRKLLCASACFLAALPATARAPEPASARWAKIVTGRLPNGLRFAILPRHGNDPGVSVLMRNEGGFIAERRPGERGLAHLIEHLFLVSPTLSAPDDARHFIRIGGPITLPAPSAGTTSWRETNLFLSTRTGNPADLDTLLGLFRETATDLSFRADVVDAQRADVMREMAGRKPGNIVYADYIAAVAPDSPNDRLDAQNSDDVPVASLATIRALYHRLYRPEAMMVVVVGDVDPARTAALIRKRFADWRPDGAAAPSTPVPTFRADRIRPISVAALPDGRRTALMTVVMPTPPAARRGQADTALMDLLATRAVNDRLAATQPGSAPGKTGIFIENGEQGHRQIMLWDNFAPGDWRPAVAGLARTACALDTTGFSDREWDAARKHLIEDLEARTGAMATTPNVELAKDLSHALAAGRDLLPPDALLRRARAWLPGVSARAGTAWWQAQWHAGVAHIRVEAPELAGAKDSIPAIRTTVDAAVGDPRCRVRP